MIALFSSVSKAEVFLEKAPYVIPVDCLDFIRGMPSGYGIVVNPSQEFGFDISPEGVLKILSENN